MFSFPIKSFTKVKEEKKIKIFIPVSTSSTTLGQGEYKLMHKLWLQDYC